LSGELIRWLTTTPEERQQGRDIARIDHAANLADMQVAAIGHVTKRAMFETMQTNLLRREAERLAPDGAELYAMITVAGAVEMTNVIARMNRPGGYRQ
jgi:hypothetical protein